MTISSDVSFIINTLNNNGHTAYIVGGSVRDSLMGKAPKDYDIATSALPSQISKIFVKTVATGEKFGTITVIIGSNNYEVTTYRIDGEYTNARHPIHVQFSNDLIEDLSRRDFTINAIAYHPTKGIVDPFKGVNDIKTRIIRTVGNANMRFNEDALRMLRCIRFSSQLGFNISTNTLSAISRNINIISIISLERVRDELIKIMLSEHIQNSIKINETHILKHIDNELYIYFQQNLKPTISQIKNSHNDIIIRLSILFKEHKNPKKILQLLKLSNNQINNICKLVFAIKNNLASDKLSIKIQILHLGSHDLFKKLLNMHKANNYDISNVSNIYEQILLNNEPIFLNQLAITGNELLEQGIPQGVDLGNILNYLHNIVLRDPQLNVKEILINITTNA